MNIRVRNLWDALLSTFWFVPGLMILGAIGLALALIALDEFLGQRAAKDIWWLWMGGADGAREVLSTVAGSMITVAGVVFSITMVALSLASQQFGPRLLRNFMRDRAHQVVLGAFLATFVYALLVLRTVRGDNGDAFVPSIAITVGLVLTLVSVGVLIYFIHHVSSMIQAVNLIAAVSHELHVTIARLFPDKLGHNTIPERPLPRLEEDVSTRLATEASAVHALTSGYIQAVDAEALMAAAVAHDVILQVPHRPGHFVVPGSELARVYPRVRLSQPLAIRIHQAFTLGVQRTALQDVEFAANQLVEIAVRALSPGLNDPFTAMQCLDRLGEGLCQLAERAWPSPYHHDEAGHLRLIAAPVTFVEVTGAAFHQIREFGGSHVAVKIRLLETITRVAAYLHREEDRRALIQHAMLVKEHSQTAPSEAWARQAVEEHYLVAIQALRP